MKIFTRNIQLPCSLEDESDKSLYEDVESLDLSCSNALHKDKNNSSCSIGWIILPETPIDNEDQSNDEC